MKAKNLLNRADLQPASLAFQSAAAHSRGWNAFVREMIAKHGDRPQGGHVSGIYSEHFPKTAQDSLASMARKVSEETDRGFALRPARVRLATMRALKSAVRAKYGAGFYG